jgi:hypothetical protein
MNFCDVLLLLLLCLLCLLFSRGKEECVIRQLRELFSITKLITLLLWHVDVRCQIESLFQEFLFISLI